MNQRWVVAMLVLPGAFEFTFSSSYSQVTRGDYDRALNLQKKYDSLAMDLPDNVSWSPTGDRFVYRVSVEGGHQFILADAATQAKHPVFNHARLAAALSAAGGHSYTAVTLPFARFHFTDGDSAIDFEFEQTGWHCDLHIWTCQGHPLFSATITATMTRRNLRTALGRRFPRPTENGWPTS